MTLKLTNDFYKIEASKPAIEKNRPEKTSKLKLSTRQQEVVFYLARGKTAKSIALALGISYRTVEHYIDDIKKKLRLENSKDLIEYAIMNNLAGLSLSNRNPNNIREENSL